MRLKYFLGLLLILQGTYCFATEQAPDYIVYNGIKYPLYNRNPMENYFNRFPEKRPQYVQTNLWRGYVATFEIIQNELWVIDIGKYDLGKYISIIEECLNGNNKMKVDWFNGFLIIPQGKLVKRMTSVFGSFYEYHRFIEFRNGNYIAEYDLNYEEFVEYVNEQCANAIEFIPEIIRE